MEIVHGRWAKVLTKDSFLPSPSLLLGHVRHQRSEGLKTCSTQWLQFEKFILTLLRCQYGFSGKGPAIGSRKGNFSLLRLCVWQGIISFWVRSFILWYLLGVDNVSSIVYIYWSMQQQMGTVSSYLARSDVVFGSLPRLLQEGTAATDSEKDLPIYVRYTTKTIKLLHRIRIRSFWLTRIRGMTDPDPLSTKRPLFF